MYTTENCPNCICCRDCINYKCNADLEDIVSTCKRIDHKKIKFAEPWFKTYDCNCFTICNDFKPRNPEYEMFKDWTTAEEFMNIWDEANNNKTNWSRENATIAFVINNNKEVRYHVPLKDYFYGTMFDGDKLKAIYKTYYKQTRKGFGYKLIKEEIDGIIVK